MDLGWGLNRSLTGMAWRAWDNVLSRRVMKRSEARVYAWQGGECHDELWWIRTWLSQKGLGFSVFQEVE